MRKLLLTLFAAVMCLAVYAQFESAPAFPGAEGHGRFTTGGRGGKVYHVTRLTDDGQPGSFRYACNQAGRRTIVFDVSGTIYLTSELRLKNGNVSILGQTAPGDGVCIADYPFSIAASNVIIRYMRFRLGNRNVANHEGDGLGGMDQQNIVIDHCSVSWSVDECLSVYGSKNISVQWCYVDQSMVASGHSKGNHGYGGNWGGSGASYHHNLLAHHTSRTPRLGPRPSTQTDERMDLRNNVIYNWGGEGCYGGEGMKVNIVNNYYKPGPGTPSGTKGMRIAAIGIRTSEYTHHDTDKPNDWDKMWHVWGKYYVNGNVNTKHSDVTSDNWTYGMYNQITDRKVDYTYTQETKDTMRIEKPIAYGYITTHTAQTAYEMVTRYAGASYRRDSHDSYITDDVLAGTAKYSGAGQEGKGFINNQDEAGGWPELASTEAPTDTDQDGIPDEWETRYGLEPNNTNDGRVCSLDKNGYYTNLEVYCNSLVEENIKAQNANALTTMAGAFTEYFPEITGGGSNPPVTPPVEEETVIYYHPGGKVNSITFDDGATLQITGNLEKTLDPASDITVDGIKYKSIKLSNGKENTFTSPEGKTAVGVTFYSYVNIDNENRTPYWASVYEQTFTAETATILKSYKDTENPDIVTFPVNSKRAFTFKNAGEQLCFLMAVTYGSATGISEVNADEKRGSLATYNVCGQRVSDSARGLVIRGGKKFIKR
ncbi:MAG: pectate lyase [Prevotella sp.]|nr:pectate lyase [Prevotella sp.]